MPEGIIRDPKQNWEEKRFGVLYSPECGYLAYDKKGHNPRRFITAGTLVTFDGLKQLNAQNVLLWEGKLIDYEVDAMTIKPEGDQGPIVRELNKKATELLTPGNPFD